MGYPWTIHVRAAVGAISDSAGLAEADRDRAQTRLARNAAGACLRMGDDSRSREIRFILESLVKQGPSASRALQEFVKAIEASLGQPVSVPVNVAGQTAGQPRGMFGEILR